jgi:pimeloyl-ACP methyl ester carboxylesterase
MLRRDFLKDCDGDRSGDCDPFRSSRGTPAIPNANSADVNGQHIFFSVQGAGKPLVLLHGGIDPDSFGSHLEELAKGRQVIAVHLQAHGRTPDTDRPLRGETPPRRRARALG